MQFLPDLKTNPSRKDITLFNYMALTKVGIPSIAAYFLYTAIFVRDPILILVIGLFLLCLFISRILINRIRSIRLLLDINTVFFGSLLFYLLCIGGEGNSRSLWMLFYPIVIFFLRDEKKTLIFNWTTFAGIIIVFINPLNLAIQNYSAGFAIRFLTIFGCESTVLYWFQQYRTRYQIDLEKKNKDLQEALDRVHVLSGFIPICSSCRKIRDDKGYWNRLEQYVSEHSDVEFSHGICPECAKKLYPDLVDKIEEEVGILPSDLQKMTKD